MIKFISHRGNIAGKNVALENSQEYVDAALRSGYSVEIDVRFVNGKLYMGHDTPDYEVDISWLEQRREQLYIHAKTVETALHFSTHGGFHFFFHNEDACTITSHGLVWVHPKSEPLPNSIFVMPEYRGFSIQEMLDCTAICTDHVIHYQDEYNKLRIVKNERPKN